MNVDLTLKFSFRGSMKDDLALRKVLDFNETTCIKKYRGESRVFIDSDDWTYIYNDVPLTIMNDLYIDINKYDGKISIIINNFSSQK